MNNIEKIINNLDFLYYNDVFEQEECHDILDDLTDILEEMNLNLECGSIRNSLFEAISNLNNISKSYKYSFCSCLCNEEDKDDDYWDEKDENDDYWIDYSNDKKTISSYDFKTNRKKAIYNLEKTLFFVDLKYGKFIFWRKNKNFKNKAKKLAKF